VADFRRGAKLGSPILVMLAIVVSACGGGDDGTSAKDVGTTGASGAQADLERFLLSRGEEPGYEPSGPVEKLSSADEFAARSPRPEAEARRLRDEGFVSFVRRELKGKEGPGVTSLILFANDAGAKREAAAERRNLDVDFRGWTLKRFDVSGVPGAFGWTATNRDAPDAPRGERVGNVTWVEGRCAMTLGNAGARSFVAPLTAGVKAVHRRVAGRCP
jgi:hypothetical protein